MNLSILQIEGIADELKKSAVPAVLGPDGQPAYQYQSIYEAHLRRRWRAMAESAAHKEPEDLTDEEKAAILYCGGAPYTVDMLTGTVSFPPCGLEKIDGQWHVVFLVMGAEPRWNYTRSSRP